MIKKVIKLVSGLLVVCLLCSCATTSTVGNGKVDPVEAATIQLAVGVALMSKPEAIIPAYGVSTALLAIMSDNVTTVTIKLVEQSVAKEVAKLKLDPLTQQSFNDLIVLVKAEIITTIDTNNIQGSDKLVVIREIIQIVHDSAEVRLKVVK